MKSLLVIYALLGLFFLASCEEEEIFPAHNNLRGYWTEITADSIKTKLIVYDDSVLYLTKPNLPTDTFLYQLIPVREQLILKKDSVKTLHDILWSKYKNELKVWELFPDTLETPSLTVFERR